MTHSSVCSGGWLLAALLVAGCTGEPETSVRPMVRYETSVRLTVRCEAAWPLDDLLRSRGDEGRLALVRVAGGTL